MKKSLFLMVMSLIAGVQHTFGQCNYDIPPSVKKFGYASREFTFSGTTINGKTTTFMAVNKGATVNITTYVESRKKGDYCPACIVQVYWGIHGHASECAKSFYGYQFKRKKTSQKFKAPDKDGIYYITWGGTLDYSCKNNVNRPRCESEHAFAVLKVGNPDPEKKITLTASKRGSAMFLNTSLIKPGCEGKPDKIEWFLDGEKLSYDDRNEIVLSEYGTYEVKWSNCQTNIARTYNHFPDGDPRKNGNSSNQAKATLKGISSKPGIKANQKAQGKIIPVTSVEGTKSEEKPKVNVTILKGTTTSKSNAGEQAEDIETLIKNSDKFVLKKLIFDLGKSYLRPEAEEELNKLAKVMLENPSMRILLEGHTDRIGSARKNLILSEDRVKSARKYLVQQGVDRKNIETKGWGHERPLIITDDVEEGKINRRVEISVLSR